MENLNKEQKQLINEWLKKFILDKPDGMLSGTWFEQFQKQHNLIDDELEEEKELCFDKKLDSEVAESLEEFSKISGKVKPTKQRLFENNENAQTITIKLPKGVDYKIEVI